ncbi:uncharacterized protein [Palaemon carinicauda]|uniref:uncharacterized protein isoform X1 n=1 Tax=Palaemon carinicauda TaxID=392227 RepID=UPI0035B5A131
MDPQDLYRLESYCVGSPQETRRKSAPDIKSTAIECITCAVGSRRDIEEDVLSVPVSLLKELDDLHTKLADEIFTWKMIFVCVVGSARIFTVRYLNAVNRPFYRKFVLGTILKRNRTKLAC